MEVSTKLEGLEELQNKIQRMLSVELEMKRVSEMMRSDIDQHFLNTSSPNGRWAKPKYRVGLPLQDTGRLKSSIKKRNKSKEAEVYTNLEYAAIHNYGGNFKAWGKFDATMPKREFMWISQKARKEIITFLKNRIMSTWK